MSEPEYWDGDSGDALYEADLDNRYADILDGAFGDVEIAGDTYSTSWALRTIDPIKYQCEFNDWLDAEVDNGYILAEDPAMEETEEVE